MSAVEDVLEARIVSAAKEILKQQSDVGTLDIINALEKEGIAVGPNRVHRVMTEFFGEGSST